MLGLFFVDKPPKIWYNNTIRYCVYIVKERSYVDVRII